MSAFYGENTPVSTPEQDSLPKLSIDHIKRLTIPTLNPWLSVDLHVSNTCHTEYDQLPIFEHSEEFLKDWQETNEVSLCIGEDGQTKIVLVSTPAHTEIAIIDWITFSFKRHTFSDSYIDVVESDIEDVCVYEMSKKLDSIFGFSLGRKKKSTLFYEKSYEILTRQSVYVGDLHIGGQNNTVLISLSGNACKLGDYGWQQGLHEFLASANGSRITRLDLAHDDIEGKYLDIDDLDSRETAGQFYRFGKPAGVVWAGDWKYLDRENKGRTLYIGSRTSDKFLRAYEKGKQLGDKTSAWLRLEVELKAKHTIIPIDAVLRPSDYFINLYPCFTQLFQYRDQQQSIVKYVKKTTQLSIKKAIQSFKNQYGKYVPFLCDLLGQDEFFRQVSVHETPKRLAHLLHDWDRVHPDFPKMESA